MPASQLTLIGLGSKTNSESILLQKTGIKEVTASSAMPSHNEDNLDEAMRVGVQSQEGPFRHRVLCFNGHSEGFIRESSQGEDNVDGYSSGARCSDYDFALFYSQGTGAIPHFEGTNWTRTFSAGPLDTDYNKYKFYRQICITTRSIYSKAARELVRHFQVESYPSKNQRWRYEHLHQTDKTSGQINY